MIEETMSLKEAAEMLSLTKTTIRNYINAGYLRPLYGPKGRGPGKPVRLLVSEIMNFFAQKTATPSLAEKPAIDEGEDHQ